MALILPILVLFLLLAIDFGRVFFGWVAVQNASRIGANQAARNPDPWSAGATDALYYLRVSKDLAGINCDADLDGDGDIDADDLADPVFTNNAGDPSDAYEIGDHVSVTLECGMSFVTPLVGLIVGSPMPITAASTFTIFGGEINGVPVAAETPTTPCLAGERQVPQLVGLSVATARQEWARAGFFGMFDPAPGFEDANLVITQTTAPSSSPGDCLSDSTSVTVTHQEPEDCTAPEINVPILRGLTVADARDAWTDATFIGDFNPAAGNDADIVETQTTSSGAQPLECADPATSVTVTFTPATPPPPPTCEMEQVLGDTPAAAEAEYRSKSFTGAFTTRPSNKPSWKVKSQSLIGGQSYPCSASLEVDLENK
ncbi:MAG: pilus assembly protein [Actinobacteria bacterium]|nr:pilus assembly protein [Actinomycetota bacterium]